MTIPLRVTSDDSGSDATERFIRAELGQLERVQPRITLCHVTLQSRAGRRGHGSTYVRVAISLPDGEVAIDHDSDSEVDGGTEDPCVTIREAFVAARRALLVHARRMRAETKAGSSTTAELAPSPPVPADAATEIS